MQLTPPVKELIAILARQRKRTRKLSHKLNNLRNMVVVLAVPRARRGVEEVVPARDELEDLPTVG